MEEEEGKGQGWRRREGKEERGRIREEVEKEEVG